MNTLTANTKAAEVAILHRVVATCGEGSLLSIEYVSGRKATPRAIVEASKAIAHGDHAIVARVKSSFYNKDGELCLCVEALNRDNVEGGKPCYRTINPGVGTLKSITILHACPVVAASMAA